ncbi:MAG TPA: hypothetical protein VFP32_02755 [Candidatus Saccharimonadales bacterium]|nr:hypothetical protein [Candidatus Saccharimonadales bacterium]
MKHIIQKSFLALATVVLGLSVLALRTNAVGGGSATLSLSPASGSYTTGNTISVAIYENSGTDQVNAVQANLTYPASLLSCSDSSVSSSSAFGVSAQSTCGSGSAQIARGTTTAVSGSQLVATVTFTAASAGTATITFAGGSAVLRSSDNGAETLTTNPASYSLSAPAPPPSGGGSSSGGATGGSGTSSGTSGSSGSSTKTTSSSSSSSSGAPAAPTSPTAPAAPTTLTISDISATNVSANSATINWTTSVAATSEVDYGETTRYVATAVSKSLTKNHSVSLTSVKLLPSKTYHYVVKSVDANGQIVTSKDQTFTTIAAAPAAAAKKNGSLLPVVIVIVLALAALGAGFFVKNRRGGGGTGGGGGHSVLADYQPTTTPHTPPANSPSSTTQAAPTVISPNATIHPTNQSMPPKL